MEHFVSWYNNLNFAMDGTFTTLVSTITAISLLWHSAICRAILGRQSRDRTLDRTKMDNELEANNELEPAKKRFKSSANKNQWKIDDIDNATVKQYYSNHCLTFDVLLTASKTRRWSVLFNMHVYSEELQRWLIFMTQKCILGWTFY